MLAWAAQILERETTEALIGRQRGTAHLKEARKGSLGRGDRRCKASRLERPKPARWAHGVQRECEGQSRLSWAPGHGAG